MDQMVSGEEDFDVDIEGGRFKETQEITANLVSAEDVLNHVWSGRLSFDGSEKIDDDLINPLTGDEKQRERSSQSLDLSDKKFDNAKFKKTRKTSKPPRPLKGPSLSENDQKLMREITELAMRKRARTERMKTLRRLKAAKSSSPCSSILAMIVTVIFFIFLIFQGFFTSNASLNSDSSPAPTNSANNSLFNSTISLLLMRESIPAQLLLSGIREFQVQTTKKTQEKLPDEFVLGFL